MPLLTVIYMLCAAAECFINVIKNFITLLFFKRLFGCIFFAENVQINLLY